MKVYVLLHGSTEFDEKGLIIGKNDPELSETGKDEARRAVTQLTEKGIDMILSAPQKYTMGTAEIVAEGIGFDASKVTKGVKLFERYFGDLDGAPKAEVDMFFQTSWLSNADTPNGETIKEVGNRIISYMNNMVKIFRTKTMLLVVPEQVAVILYWFFNGLPDAGSEHILGTENGKVYVYDTDTIPDSIKNYDPNATEQTEAEEDPHKLLSQAEIDALIANLVAG